MENVYELNIRLKIEKILLRYAQRQIAYLVNNTVPNKYPGGSYKDGDSKSNHRHLETINILKDIQYWEYVIGLQKQKISEIENDIKEIHKLISSLTGLKQKVEYMTKIEGKKLKEISDELGYSEQYIRRIAAK